MAAPPPAAPVRVSADEIRGAADALRAVAAPTPLVHCAPLAERAGVPVWLKCEQFQPIGAFKVRGAWTAITRLPEPDRARGIVTHSSGNHGQAVAFVARRLGLRAVIVMPESAPAVKVAAVRGHGAEVVFVEPVPSARAAMADRLAAEQGLTLVPPYDDLNIVLGQATCAWEVLSSRDDITTLAAPIGGGGLLAGTAAAAAALRPHARVVGVEPAAIPKLTAALAAGTPAAVPHATSVADGLLPLSVGRLTFEIIRTVVREAVPVTDEAIADAMQLLYWDVGIRVEPSGAATTAALLSGKLRPDGPTALILSGGNVDPDRFAALTSR